MRASAAHSSLWTVVAVAVVAYAACDMVHEVIGHGLACALSGIRALSLSTVALQTASSSRLVAAAGSIANVLVGVLSLFAFRRGTTFSASRYFLWLFASVNLLNGTGYPLFSAVLDFGDWAVVIAGLEPHWAWRVVLGVLSSVLYAGTIVLMAANLVPLVRHGDVDRGEVPRLVFAAYLTGGLLLVAGAALNPVGPRLILLSGVSSGFGAMAGLHSRHRGSADDRLVGRGGADALQRGLGGSRIVCSSPLHRASWPGHFPCRSALRSSTGLTAVTGQLTGGLMADVNAVLAGNRAAVNDLIAAAERSGAVWTVPRAPGKWSPSQVVEHVARALEESAKVVSGAPSRFLTFHPLLRPLLRGLFFNRVLKKSAFPKTKTNKALDPASGPATPAEARVRLEVALNKFDRECRARAAHGQNVACTIFGTVSVEDYARFQELHTRHHCQQMPTP